MDRATISIASRCAHALAAHPLTMSVSANRLPPLLLTGLAGLLLLGHALWGWIPILDRFYLHKSA